MNKKTEGWQDRKERYPEIGRIGKRRKMMILRSRIYIGTHMYTHTCTALIHKLTSTLTHALTQPFRDAALHHPGGYAYQETATFADKMAPQTTTTE